MYFIGVCGELYFFAVKTLFIAQIKNGEKTACYFVMDQTIHLQQVFRLDKKMLCAEIQILGNLDFECPGFGHLLYMYSEALKYKCSRSYLCQNPDILGSSFWH